MTEKMSWLLFFFYPINHHKATVMNMFDILIYLNLGLYCNFALTVSFKNARESSEIVTYYVRGFAAISVTLFDTPWSKLFALHLQYKTKRWKLWFSIDETTSVAWCHCFCDQLVDCNFITLVTGTILNFPTFLNK